MGSGYRWGWGMAGGYGGDTDGVDGEVGGVANISNAGRTTIADSIIRGRTSQEVYLGTSVEHFATKALTQT